MGVRAREYSACHGTSIWEVLRFLVSKDNDDDDNSDDIDDDYRDSNSVEIGMVLVRMNRYDNENTDDRNNCCHYYHWLLLLL